jgi:hypothetical protein
MHSNGLTTLTVSSSLFLLGISETSLKGAENMGSRDVTRHEQHCGGKTRKEVLLEAEPARTDSVQRFMFLWTVVPVINFGFQIPRKHSAYNENGSRTMTLHLPGLRSWRGWRVVAAAAT